MGMLVEELLSLLLLLLDDLPFRSFTRAGTGHTTHEPEHASKAGRNLVLDLIVQSAAILNAMVLLEVQDWLPGCFEFCLPFTPLPILDDFLLPGT